MSRCNDPFLAALKSFGYSAVRLPRADLPPLYLLGGRGAELDRVGELGTVMTGAALPPVTRDAPSVAISGQKARTGELGLGVGLSLLGNVIAAMGGSRAGLDAQYQSAAAVEFEFLDVKEDSVEVAALDQYLAQAAVHPHSREVARMLDRGEVYVVTAVLKSTKLSVRAKASGGGAVTLDVPAVSAAVGGRVKVTASGSQASVLQYEGPVPLVFGFQAVRLRFREGQYDRFERLAPGAAAARSLDGPAAGIGPGGAFADLAGEGEAFARLAPDRPGGAAPGRRALLVGINAYPKLPFANQLKGCVADVHLMAGTLKTVFGFPAEDVRVLTDAEARRDDILAALDRLVRDTRPDDAVVIHYSGHGSRVKDREGDEPSGWDSTIVPSDSGRGPGDVRDITDDEIWSRLLDLAARTANVTLLFDCCHSGTIDRDAFGGAGRGIDPAAADAALPPASVSPTALASLAGTRGADRGPTAGLPPSQSYVLLAGCREEQKSFEYTAGGSTHGALTYFLHRELVAAGPRSTYRDVFDAARLQVTGAFPTQQPQLAGAADRVLFGTARLDPVPFLPVTAVAGAAVGLGGGAAHGVTPGSVWGVYPPGTKVPVADKQLGRVTVETATALTATGPLTDAPAGAAVAAGCRAVEERRAAADPRLPVEVVDRTGTGAAAVAHLRALVGGEKLLKAVDAGGAVRVYAVPAGGPGARNGAVPTLDGATPYHAPAPAWVAVGLDGQVIGAPVPMAAPDGGGTVVENLAKVARFRNILGLTSPAANNPLAGAVGLTLLRRAADGRAWVEAAPEPDGRVVFADGEPLRLRLFNGTGGPVYATVLDFGLTFGVTQLFPVANAQPTLQPGRYDYPPAADDPLGPYIPPGFRLREGVETLKLIATTDPADFSLFQQQGVRGDRAASPLAEALEWAYRGETRDLRPPAAARTTTWTTVERSFVLRRRPD